MKVDLHLHSKHSKRPSQWVLQKIGCPESFTEPEALYRFTRKMGMTAMTLTDHNTINGCLEIAQLPAVFISEEVTTYFPEDGCKAHVLVYDIDESVHKDLQRIRPDIYELTAYLQEHGIVHSLAHPLFSINDRLRPEHFERFLLLFKVFELNGARDEVQNRILAQVLGLLTPGKIEELANRYDLEPGFREPWKKGLTGGSDDHSSLSVARMHSHVPGAASVAEFLEAVGTDRCRPKGRGSSPRTLAHHLYGIAYQFYNRRLNLEQYSRQDVLMRFLDRSLKPESSAGGDVLIRLRGLWNRRSRRYKANSGKLEDVLRLEGEKMIYADPGLLKIVRNRGGSAEDKDERWFGFVSQISNQVMLHFGEDVFSRLSGVNVFSIFNAIGSAGALYSLLAPYFVAFKLFSRDAPLALEIRNSLAPVGNDSSGADREPRVAHFTDTLFEVNGVAQTLRQQARIAAETGKALDIITCARAPHENLERVVCFEPVSVHELAEYPEQKLLIPPFLEMLNHVYERGYNYIHSATPGPIGLAALGISRILGLPISGTYHTELPQYAAYLTGDEAVEQLVWRYTLWYYDQMDFVYVPSMETGRELVEKGLKPDKVRHYPRGVDLERYHPRFRNGFYQLRHGLGDETKLIYVGRVSKEKNLPLLAGVFKTLSPMLPGLHLVIVGEGPYLAEMRKELTGYPVTFTGYLSDGDLSEAYASADLFVFPSATDTFGNVILEAQASGLPVIVTDTGGPRENMRDKETGLIVPAGDPDALRAAVLELAGDPLRLKKMGRAARRYVENRSFQKAFMEHWKLYSRETSVDPALAKAS
ncbi:MAG: glycosyltransferase [Proteobacteria bacterium]|nr:glycosyltransferase [Pseudomonadota bacterium]